MSDEALSAAQRGKIRRISAPRELSPDEEGGELNIVPFLDIITNVLMFVLATVTVTFTATIETFPPKAGGSGARPPTVPTLNLTVIIVNEGFSLKARGGNVASGCSDTGAGLAVPKLASGEYNYDELTRCAAKLKNLSPDFAEETQVTVSANPNIPFQAIISTIDAVRNTEDGKELFPDVNFGLAK